MSELHWKKTFVGNINDENHTVEQLDEWVTLKNTFVGNGNVYQWVTMRNMENDKNHTVEHIRWVSYTEKHSLETGICNSVYQCYNENMENDKNHTVEHIRWVSYTEKHIRWKRDL